MTELAPSSRELAYVTPTKAEVLLRCPLRVAFGQERSSTGSGRPATWIGDAAHQALERIVNERTLWGRDPSESVQSVFDEEILRQFERLPAAATERWGGDPRRLPGFALKRARLGKVAARLATLLRAVDFDSVLPEIEYSVFHGRLKGRADLVVDDSTLHAVADYKTGRTTEGNHDPLPAYQRQVRLYCAMEEERSGSPPDVGLLIPLDGPFIEIAADSAECRALVEEVLRALEGFNDRIPGPQPAIVSPENCPNCPYAPRCPSFWGQPSDGLPDHLVALRGTVDDVRRSEMGGLTVKVGQATGSSAFENETLVRNIPESEHPGLQGLDLGMEIKFVGLIQEPERGTYRLSRGGHAQTLAAQD